MNQYQKTIKELDDTLASLNIVTSDALNHFNDNEMNYKVIRARSKNIQTVLEQERYKVIEAERMATTMLKTSTGAK